MRLHGIFAASQSLAWPAMHQPAQVTHLSADTISLIECNSSFITFMRHNADILSKNMTNKQKILTGFDCCVLQGDRCTGSAAEVQAAAKTEGC